MVNIYLLYDLIVRKFVCKQTKPRFEGKWAFYVQILSGLETSIFCEETN